MMYLHMSCDPDPLVITQILEAGIDVHAENVNKCTAFLCAAYNKHSTPKVFDMLVSVGADPTVSTLRNKNALQCFVTMIGGIANPNQSSVIDCLIKHGVDLDQVDDQGDSALILACKP